MNEVDELISTRSEVTEIKRAADTFSFITPGDDKTKVVTLEEDSETEDAVRQENLEHQGIVRVVTEQFERSKTKRQSDESRWLEAYRNYRGLYGPDTQFAETEKSRVFVKATKMKVGAAFAKLSEVLFAGSKFPIGIEPSAVAEGIEESVYFDPKEVSDEPEEGGGMPSSIARPELRSLLGPLKEPLKRVPEDKLKEGSGLTPTSLTWEPAKEAARLMEKEIHDQLHESDANKALRHFLFEMCLFGTGIMKGPFAVNKEYAKWDESGVYTPLIKRTAKSEHVSVWDAYPDPDARSMTDAESFIQRHRMTKSELRSLKKRQDFRPISVDLAVDAGSNYENEYWENTLKDYETQSAEINRYEVLEYWGMVDREMAEKVNLEIPKEFDGLDEIQVNIWVCNGYLLRLIMNPFTPTRIPYHSCPYELNPYSFFGIGVAENMNDTQLLMNGFMRQAVDNAVLSGHVVFEVDETNLVPGQDMTIYPGKIFRRQSGAPGQAIFATKFPNTTQENMLLFDKARQLSDESTGIPSYAHGMTGVTNTGRTAAGMSMLMGAADQNIKAVVKNVDDYLLVPWGNGYFAFNMQFNFKKKFIGDVSVVARGTESLLRNEIRTQKLLQFLQITNNPNDAPFTKRDYLLREVAASLDIEPDKAINDPREAGIQAFMIAERNKAMGINPEAQAGAGNPAGMPMPSDPTGNGGGNIAPGAGQGPGEPGFTGSGGGANTPEAQAAQAQMGM